MYQYVNWFKDDNLIKNKKDNEKIKRDPIKYIIHNIPILEEWSGCKWTKIIYDPNKHSKSSKILKNKTINYSRFCFIIINSNNNVFGHYHKGIINDIDCAIYDSNIFIISLNSNGRNGINKFERKNIHVHL